MDSPLSHSKRIVVCADGTWNLRDQVDKATGKRRPTNVTKVARAVKPVGDDGRHQLVIYLDGVGTGGGMDRLTGGAFGHGIEENVRSLYRSIAYNYADGDEIFMFGFSRGAFTVRTLAGFMHNVGLVAKDNDYYLPEIYGCYEKGHHRGSKEWDATFANRNLGKNHRPAPPIRFVGAWDTVGALGAPGFIGQLFNRRKYAYHEVGLVPEIQNAYQALAIDERRKPFTPVIWSKAHAASNASPWNGTLQQAWFTGVHCNVGGSEDPDGLANEALHWIVEKAESLGLTFDDRFLSYYTPCFNSEQDESMTLMYRALGINDRDICMVPESNECVHQSVVDRRKHSNPFHGGAKLIDCLDNRSPTVVDTARIPRGTPCPPMPRRAPNGTR